MRIPFLPNSRFGLRWSLLSVAAIAAIAAAANYEEPMYSPAPLENAAVGKTNPGAGKLVLRGSISGVLAENPSVASDAPEISASLRALASLDREWRALLAPRSSTEPPRRASLWSFVSGAKIEDPDTEYSEVVGDRLDEKFFREMKTLLTKRQREAQQNELALAEEAAASQAASASFRAGLIASLANQQPEHLSAGTDFWETMATAPIAPINVHSQGEASGSSGNSAPATAGFSGGDGGNAGGSDRPYSFWPQPVADQTGGSAGSSFSPSVNSFPAIPAPTYNNPGTPSGNGGGHHYHTAPSQRAATGSYVAHTNHSSVTTGNSPTVPKSTSSGTVTTAAVTESTRSEVVASQSGSLTVSQPSVITTASVASRPTTIYVANFGGNTLNEYNQATGSPTAGFNPISLSNVNQVAVANGILYVMTFTGTIGTYDATTGAAINPSLVTGINQAEGMILSGNTLYVTSFGAGLLAFNATTGASVPGFTPPTIHGPRGIAISGNHLYVVSNIDDTVGEYDATTGAAIAGFTSPTSFVQASAVAVNGNILYVADISANQIGEYNATTGATINSNFISTSGTIFQISVSGNDLYVPFFSNSALGVYDLTSGAPDPNYTSLSGLNRPYGVLAIPEPGSLVLLAAGVVGLFGCGRRRGARKGENAA